MISSKATLSSVFDPDTACKQEQNTMCSDKINADILLYMSGAGGQGGLQPPCSRAPLLSELGAMAYYNSTSGSPEVFESFHLKPSQ